MKVEDMKKAEPLVLDLYSSLKKQSQRIESMEGELLRARNADVAELEERLNQEKQLLKHALTIKVKRIIKQLNLDLGK